MLTLHIYVVETRMFKEMLMVIIIYNLVMLSHYISLKKLACHCTLNRPLLCLFLNPVLKPISSLWPLTPSKMLALCTPVNDLF